MALAWSGRPAAPSGHAPGSGLEARSQLGWLGTGSLSRDPTDKQGLVSLLSLGRRSPRLGPANLANTLESARRYGEKKTTVFLVWQKFPSHFFLISHHLAQVPVLAGLLRDSLPTSWGRGVCPNTHPPTSVSVGSLSSES